MGIDRREWIKMALAGTAGLSAARLGLAQGATAVLPRIKSTFNGVIVGCNTYSLTRLSLDEAIRAIASIGIGAAELHPRHIEPSFGPTGAVPGSAGGGRATGGANPAPAPRRGPTPEMREKLRQWRLTVPLEEFEAAGKKFRDAGIYIYAYNMNFPADDFTEAEIERSFEMTRALGAAIMVPAVGTSLTIPRLDPFARKYKIRYGIHNENDIRTPEDFDRIRKGLSDYAAITLDIGHFVASGSDPIDYLNKHQDDIVNVHVKDRKKNNGATVPFGEGETPIKEALLLMRERKYRVPAAIEYENRNVDPVEGLRASFDYCKQVLLG